MDDTPLSLLEANTLTATSLVADDDISNILEALRQPSGSQEKFKKRWIEFDCQKGVHHGKWAEYKNGKRIRTEGGYIGRFDLVAKLGEYATRRVREFPRTHDCHYPERFQKDLDECGVGGIAVEGWPSGRSVSGLSDGRRPSGSEEHRV